MENFFLLLNGFFLVSVSGLSAQAPLIFTAEPSGSEIRSIDNVNVLHQYDLPVPSFDTWNKEEEGRYHISLNGDWKFTFEYIQYDGVIFDRADPFKHQNLLENSQGMAGAWFGTDFNDDSWRVVTVPHVWDLIDIDTEDWYNSNLDFDANEAFKREFGWYRKEVDIPGEAIDGRFVRLNALAVESQAWVFVNGQFVGAHDGGNQAFSLDISDFVTSGQNTIALRVWRRPKVKTSDPNVSVSEMSENQYFYNDPRATIGPGGAFPYGGIKRDIWIESVNKVRVSKILTDAKDGVLDLYAVVSNAGLENQRVQLTMDPGTGDGGAWAWTTVPAGGTRVVQRQLTIPSALDWSYSAPTVYDTTVNLNELGGSTYLWTGLNDARAEGAVLSQDNYDAFDGDKWWQERIFNETEASIGDELPQGFWDEVNGVATVIQNEGFIYVPTGIQVEPNTTYTIDFAVGERASFSPIAIEYGLWHGTPEAASQGAAKEEIGAWSLPSVGTGGYLDFSGVTDGSWGYVSDLSGGSPNDEQFTFTTGADVSAYDDELVLFVRNLSPGGAYRLYFNNISIRSKRSADSLTAHYGVRDLAIENSQIKLNGQRVLLKGFVAYDDIKPEGVLSDESEYQFLLDFVKNTLGSNFLRVHKPHPKFKDIADRRGVLLMDEIYNNWLNPDLMDYQVSEYGLSQSMAASMVWNSANNPSIAMWSLGNELTDPASSAADNFVNNLNTIAKQLDVQNRPTTVCLRGQGQADNAFAQHLDVYSFNTKYDNFSNLSAEENPDSDIDGLRYILNQIQANFPGKPVLFSETGPSWTTDLGAPKLNQFALWDFVLSEEYPLLGIVYWSLNDFKTPNKNLGQGGFIRSGIIKENFNQEYYLQQKELNKPYMTWLGYHFHLLTSPYNDAGYQAQEPVFEDYNLMWKNIDVSSGFWNERFRRPARLNFEARVVDIRDLNQLKSDFEPLISQYTWLSGTLDDSNEIDQLLQGTYELPLPQVNIDSDLYDLNSGTPVFLQTFPAVDLNPDVIGQSVRSFNYTMDLPVVDGLYQADTEIRFLSNDQLVDTYTYDPLRSEPLVSTEAGSNHPLENAFDGDASTHWQIGPVFGTGSWYRNVNEWVTIPFDQAHVVNTFGYLPRQDSQNGRVSEYNIYVKERKDGDFKLFTNGTFDVASTDLETIDLSSAGPIYAIKFNGVVCLGGYMAAAELSVDKELAYKSATSTRAEFPLENAFDSDAATYWAADVQGASFWDTTINESITIDFDQPYRLQSLNYLPRQDSQYGRLLEYDVYVKNDTNSPFKLVESRTKSRVSSTKDVVDLSSAGEAIAVKFVGKEGIDGRMNVAELEVIKDLDNYYLDVRGEEYSATSSRSGRSLTNLHDDDAATFWASLDDSGSFWDTAMDESVIIELDRACTVSSLNYLPRQDSQYGRVLKYHIFVKKPTDSDFAYFKTGTLDREYEQVLAIDLSGAGEIEAIRFQGVEGIFGMMAVAELTVVKQLEVINLTGSVYGKGNVSVYPETAVYKHGKQVGLTAAAAEGQTFIRWEGDLSGQEDYQVITMDSDMRINAVFEEAYLDTTGRYQEWLSDFELSAENGLTSADPDRDGVSNALEFVFGGNPLSQDRGSLPEHQFKLDTETGAPNSSVFTFMRNRDAIGEMDAVFEYTEDLGTGWTSLDIAHGNVGGVSIVVSDAGNGNDKVEVTIPNTVAGVDRLFVRLVALPNRAE